MLSVYIACLVHLGDLNVCRNECPYWVGYAVLFEMCIDRIDISELSHFTIQVSLAMPNHDIVAKLASCRIGIVGDILS